MFKNIFELKDDTLGKMVVIFFMHQVKCGYYFFHLLKTNHITFEVVNL